VLAHGHQTLSASPSSDRTMCPLYRCRTAQENVSCRRYLCLSPGPLTFVSLIVPGIDAICIPNTFIINIGDQFARWTNDIFVSTRHRARPATTKDRYSIPFFFGCDHDVPLIPPPTCMSEERPVRYEVMTAGAYVHMRLSETYTVGKSEA
jgi:hypothetical protein